MTVPYIKYCPKCKKNVESFHGRCWSCGSKLEEVKNVESSQQSKK